MDANKLSQETTGLNWIHLRLATPGVREEEPVPRITLKLRAVWESVTSEVRIRELFTIFFFIFPSTLNMLKREIYTKTKE
jgi:hypothetical protein